MAEATPPSRAFTARALLFGLLGGGGIVLFAGFNDEILNQSLLVGNHFPVGAYFYLLALVTLWNPLALALAARGADSFPGRLGRRLTLSGRELAVVTGIALVACWAPTSGLSRYAARILVMPVTRYATNPRWEVSSRYLPERLFPEGREGWRPDADAEQAALYERVYMGYARGGADGAGLAQMSGPFDWPWREWAGMFAYWGPLIAFFAVASVAMAFLAHGQWARREQLAYPLATIAGALVERAPERRLPTVFGSRMFLWAMASVMAVHLLRWQAVWHPDVIPSPPLEWYIPFRDQWTALAQAGWFAEGNGYLYFSIIGITYFLSGEIGFTLGVSQLLLAFIATQYYIGAGKPLGSADLSLVTLGAYLAYAAMFLWVGREWYRRAFLHAFAWRARGLPEDAAVAASAARAILVALLGFWGVLVWGGTDWLASAVFTVFLHLVSLVFMRLICETGMPFLNVHDLHFALAKLVGHGAVGPGPYATLALTHDVLFRDPRECLSPYAATASETAAKAGVDGRRLLRWLAVVAVLAAAAGLWTRNWVDYNRGALMGKDPAPHTYAPNAIMTQIALMHGELVRSGRMEAAEEATGLGKLALAGPEAGTWPFAAVGAAAVVCLTLARHRWSWWPLHPALLLVWNTYAMTMLSHCFLIGWAVKGLVMQFGGGRVYQRLKPLFLGLIVGEIAIGGLIILAGWAYYLKTGHEPRAYLILPK